MEQRHRTAGKAYVGRRRMMRAGWGVLAWLVALAGFGQENLRAQETLPPVTNPYAGLNIPPGPYSSGVGNLASGAPDEPIPGFVNGMVNPLILGWAAQVVDYSPANPAAIQSYWTNVQIVLQPVTGNVFDVVSLGDLSAVDIAKGVAPGSLTVRFAEPVGDGPGPDLVIFGNAFQLAGSTRVFAKLAYVEVSTDGVTFARFPSVDTNPHPAGATWPYVTSDATKIYNLFGKAVNAYGPSWGNPFDLRDLAGNPLVQSGAVDLQNIRYVRLVAVPGSGSYQDSFGDPIYGPWPTYGSPGPEIQAIGFLNRGQPPQPAAPAARATHAAGAAPAMNVAAKPSSAAAAAVAPAKSSARSASSGYGSSGLVYAGAPDTLAVSATSADDADDSTNGQDPARASIDLRDMGATGPVVAANLRARAAAAHAFPQGSATSAEIERPRASPRYYDQSFYPSGIQARITSTPATGWGDFVQRTAYLTGWEPTPARLAGIGTGCALTLALLFWRIGQIVKRHRAKRNVLNP